ncbi:YciI family protein [Phaeodactylibacter xiamenensis]|uniref:YciI family protein n=1 Tax=Phaeodactylibacter xiamenensis TaxID=1524460 RepID=UPI003BACED4F
MKKQLPSLSLLLVLALSCGQGPVETASETPASPEEANRPVGAAYDSLLAQELGADDYGMKVYVMAFLYRGEATGLDSLRRAELQRAHLDNITRMAEAGDLVLAGPFMDGQDLRGIYVFDVRTVAEAEALTNTDPAIKAGTLRMELRPWYGSAALMKVNELHEQVAKIDI